MPSIVIRGVEFAVAHPTAGAHVLQVSGFDNRAVPHAVLMLQFPFNNVAEDFRIAMRMGAKPLPGLDNVVIDDTQRTKTHLVGIEKFTEGEGMAAVQPA